MKTDQLNNSVVPRRIFVSLNRYGRPNIEPKFFKARFVKTSDRAGKCILSQSRDYFLFFQFFFLFFYTKFYFFSDSTPNHGRSPSVSFKYTLSICNGMYKKILDTTLNKPKDR